MDHLPVPTGKFSKRVPLPKLTLGTGLASARFAGPAAVPAAGPAIRAELAESGRLRPSAAAS